MTAMSPLASVWANNESTADDSDAVVAVRRFRHADSRLAAAKCERVAAAAEHDARAESEVEANLVAQLDLSR